MNELYRNGSGYADPTVGKALSRILRDDRHQREAAALDEMKHRPKVYVVAKYRDDPEVNAYRVRGFCRYVVSQGRMPVASHLLFPQFLDMRDDFQAKLGRQFGLSLLSMCDEVWVFNRNRELTDGMRLEIKEARMLGKPVKYHDEQELRK